MNDESISKFLAGRRVGTRVPKTPFKVAKRPTPQQDTFQDFSATHLFCPACRSAQPVREKILLYLPDGDLYSYSCTVCNTNVGTRKSG